MLWRATLTLCSQQPSLVFVQCVLTSSNTRCLTKVYSTLRVLKPWQAAVVVLSLQNVLPTFTLSPQPQLHWPLDWWVSPDFWSNGHPRVIWPPSWTATRTLPTKLIATPALSSMEEAAHQVVVVTQESKPTSMFNMLGLLHQRFPTSSEFEVISDFLPFNCDANRLKLLSWWISPNRW